MFESAPCTYDNPARRDRGEEMIRLTRQRRAILAALEEAGRPLTPTELHASARATFPKIGLRTVYRNISELVSAGQLVGIDYPGQPLRYERVTRSGHRPHFICRGCARVYDLQIEVPPVEVKPPPGFTIEGEEVVFFGRCPDCRE